MSKIINKCPLCESTSNKKVFTGNYNVLQCQSCQLYFHEKYYSTNQLKDFYANNYGFGNRGGHDVIRKGNESRFSETKYNELLKRSLRKRFIPVIDSFIEPKSILEIGADAGGASIYMKEKGHDIEAIELCLDYAKRIEKHGIKVYNDLFENIKFNKKYDIIVALEVIEHLSNPVFCIDKIYDLLNNDGYFIFETPIADAGLMEHATYGIQQAHYCVFNPVSLVRYLHKFVDIPVFTQGNGVYKVRKYE